MLVNTTPLVLEFSTNFNFSADGVRSSGSWVKHCSWSAKAAVYKQVILSR